MQGVLDGRGRSPRLQGQEVSGLLTVALVGAVVLLALWLRWDRLQYTEFGPDQAGALALARDAIASGSLPTHGVYNSAGGVQGPVEVWLLTIPLAVSADPIVATAFIGLLQVLALIGAYWLAARYFGSLAGLAAATLFAVNPWALHYSRKVWTPESLPLFTVLFFASLYASVVERRCLGLTLAYLWWALAFLTHPQAIGLAPVLALVTLWRWRQFGARPFLLGLALAAVVAAPYVYYQSQHGFYNFLAIYRAAGGDAVMTLRSLQVVVAMASASSFPDLLQFAFRSPAAYPDLTLANWLATLLLGLGLAVCLGHLVPRPAGEKWRMPEGWQKYLLLLLWIAVPAVLHARQGMDLHPHYVIYVLPAQHILLGVALAWLSATAGGFARRFRLAPGQLGTGFVVACVLFLAVSQTLFFRTYLDHIEALGPMRPYGTPLVFIQRAVEAARSLDAELGEPWIAAYGFLHRDPLDYLAGPDLELHHVDRPLEVMLPRKPGSGQLAMLCADDSMLAWRPDGVLFNFHAAEDDGPIIPKLLDLGFRELEDRTVRGPDGFTYFRFFYLPAATEAQTYASFTKPPGSFVLNNGMRLVGYSFAREVQAGGTAWVRLLWDLPLDRSPYPYAEHNVFVHAVDRRGAMVAQKDRELVQYLGWRVDGLVLTEHEVPIPTDAAPRLLWLDVGAYERFGRQSVPWRDASGKETGPALKVGPLRVTVPTPPDAPAVAAQYKFGDWLELEGHDLADARARAGDAVELRLHWRAIDQPPGDYVVSVQLLDQGGRLVAQHDSPAVQGNYPTAYWATGERVVDAHVLSLPQDLPAGQYDIYAVVYSAENQKRLPVGSADSAHLGPLAVR